LRFIAKMGELIVCYANKYTIKSVDSTDSIQARNINLLQTVDWVDVIYNSRELRVWSTNFYSKYLTKLMFNNEIIL
jgi:hypothetical protein